MSNRIVTLAYVDYSGTIWANAMARRDNPGRDAVLREVTDWLAANRGVEVLGGLGFENAYALAMRRERAEALGTHTIDDIARHAAELTIGGDYEFFGRPEWRALQQAYGLGFKSQREYHVTFLFPPSRATKWTSFRPFPATAESMRTISWFSKTRAVRSRPMTPCC
ncbi:MAG: glycine betaine ABC transporter substrate-binding protein [Methylocystis silviterrae]|uniref:glycine betaine ABC transporter substrate-binding protein n=1 Tax=Methylocystis silviterrae TaxID=2743612 RepID=UPI003C75B840